MPCVYLYSDDDTADVGSTTATEISSDVKGETDADSELELTWEDLQVFWYFSSFP